ncbi:MAG: hypothetical protein RL701_6301 [Pseudomonadota bacterium]
MENRLTDQEQVSGRLIILGGGIAALTAAFYASEPNEQAVFPGGIHVYESTDRLGGKGASGRGKATDAGVDNRVEEHGLHVWFGFYDNAFALLAKCHDYLEDAAQNRNHVRWSTSLRNVDDGFRPCSRVAIMDHDGTSWRPWVADFPEDPGTRPWQQRAVSGPLGTSPSALARRALKLAETFLRSLPGPYAVPERAKSSLVDTVLLPVPQIIPIVDSLSRMLDRICSVPSGGETLGTQAMLSRALEMVAGAAREVCHRSDEVLRRHDSARRLWYVVDLLLASVRGLIDDGVVLTGDFEAIDDLDLREWLVLHGASEESVSSGLLKSLVYDLAFAYENGDPALPRCSAATGVYGLLRLLLTYRGAIMWKMNAGMGEIVFAPIYEALILRGVRFHFRHEVAKVVVTDASTGPARAERITFASAPKCPAKRLPEMRVESGPLAGTLPYWGVSGPAESETPNPVEVGPHDMVVYGLPVGTIESVLTCVPAPWLLCANKVKTVATVSLQLWIRAPVTELASWASPDITVGAYTEPFDTWSDMAVLAGERWPQSVDGSSSVAYFTNVAPDSMGLRAVEDAAKRFCESGLAELWPGYRHARMAFDSYLQLNSTPTARYSLSVPGSMAARLVPSDTSICNVRPVGDWTKNSLNAGCIEAAVISGMLAARTLRPDRILPIFGENL